MSIRGDDVTGERQVPRRPDERVWHAGLYRAMLSCQIGRDALDGTFTPPDGVTPMELAVFNALHALEEIAKAMMETYERR